jgi:hypothetical protein
VTVTHPITTTTTTGYGPDGTSISVNGASVVMDGGERRDTVVSVRGRVSSFNVI